MYDHEAWAEPSAGEEEASLEIFSLEGTDLPDWELVQVYDVSVADARQALQTIWRSRQSPDVLLRIDIVVAPSAREARAALLRLLNEFQSPELRRRQDAAIGDVAFEMPGGTAILFAYANVVVQLRNAGSTVIGLTDVAREVETALRKRGSR